jgi:hypothetical protein
MKEKFMKSNNTCKSIAFRLFLLGFFIAPVFPAQQTITVTGIVVDSATHLPVSQALIGLYDTTVLTLPNLNDIASIAQLSGMVSNMIGSGQVDTFSTAADGKISYSMKIASNSWVLLCGVLKPGYNFGFSARIFLPIMKTINLDTIKISKIPQTNAKDTIIVSGTIVESSAGTPVADCQIKINGPGGVDSVVNSATSNVSGIFTQQVIIGSSSTPILVYAVTKDGYQSVIGQQAYSGKQVDFGVIKIKKTANTGVLTTNKILPYQKRTAGVKIYTSSGRLLFAGPIAAWKKDMAHFHGLAFYSLTVDGTCTVKNTQIVLP